MRYLVRIRWALFVLVGASFPLSAQAGGYDVTSVGAGPVGRGGAVVASTDDGLALLYNPARLALVRDYQLTGTVNLHFVHRCFERVEVVEDAAGARAPGAVLPNVCNETNPSPIPQFALTLPILDGLTLGVGVFVPPATLHTSFGDGRAGTTSVAGASVPNPARYNIVDQRLVVAIPTVGFGWEIVRGLRLGGAFGWGIASIDFTNFVYGGPGIDVRANFGGTDVFFPRATVSLHASPLERLEVGATFMWTGDIRAEGHLDLFLGEPLPIDQRIADASLTVPQPWVLSFGARYAHPLAGGPVDDIGDRMSTEAWDLEANIVVEGNHVVDAFTVTLPADATIGPGLPAPDRIELPHRWLTQYGLRLGGDYNVVPGRLALRAGFSFETRGVRSGYEQLDFLPLQRYGMHLGATARFGRFDLTLAYARLLQPTVDVSVERAQLRRNVAGLAGEGDAAIMNAGRYRSSFDVAALQATYHF